MPKYCFLLCVLFSLAAAAQTSLPKPSKPPSESKKGAATSSKAAELAIDTANRWTQAALQDSSNLQALERDFLLARLAHEWNAADHARAEDYLTTALDHLHSDLEPKDNSSHSDPSPAIMLISADVLAVDRAAWDHLLSELPPSAVSEAASMEAQNQAADGDIAKAMDLEKTSLANGGSENDASTLFNLISRDTASASALFDEILSAASKPGSDSNLLTMTTQWAFLEKGSPEFQSFFDESRQHRLLDLLAQQTLSGEENGACRYTFETARLFSRFPAVLQGQLQPVIANCQSRDTASVPADETAKDLDTTDEIVRAMNEAPNPKAKQRLRELAIRKASEKDHDFERALHLCLEVTDPERETMGSFSPMDRFDNCAINNGSQAAREALRKKDDLQLQRVLSILPARIKSQVELSTANLLAMSDKPRALLMLSDARRNLEQELPIRTVAYFQQLSLTAKLAPGDVNLAWRILGTGLNNFDQTSRTKTQAWLLRAGITLPSYPNPIDADFIPQNAIVDENLVRSVTEDLNSPEFRASLRLGVIEAFLTRYSEAVKSEPAAPRISSKN